MFFFFFFSIVKHLWKADLAIDAIKAEYPSEAARLKKTLVQVENEYYILLQKAKQSIDSLDSKFAETDEPQEENVRNSITFSCTRN